ncbi:MAG: hypothetical protein QM541_14155 [Flavobacterium sp.]|nr:hypothetical protein [Flavobacterium sp.]
MKTFIRKYRVALLIATFVLPLFAMAQQPKIANFRAYDKSGINVFETSKSDTAKFDGLKVRWGAGFTQQYQSLTHENTAVNNSGTGSAGVNRLYPIAPGFMTAQANLFMDVQLADGIKLNLTSYLSSRHHNETWVKGGYIQFDKVPFKGQFWDNLMKIATIKIGHFEVNYGDAHFRRSDGGQALYNPFMEGNIADAYATEIGGEVYLQKNGFFGMIAATNGMIKGHIDSVFATVQDDNTNRSPSLYLKGGVDKSLGDIARVRVTGSFYHNSSAAGSGLTLYGGDRTGSNYQNVIEKGVPGALPASTAVAFSGRLNPGFSKKVDAFMLNGFLKIKGLELFGTYETASGRTKTETANRKMTQLAGDAVYRVGKAENVFFGLRYNTVKAALAGATQDVTVNRFAVAGGWFITKNVMMKAEYVTQQYKDFAVTDYRNGGKFKGLVIEAVVGF